MRRELREEISAELQNVVFSGIIENIFTNNDEMGHEIVLLFDAELAEAASYEAVEKIEGVENNDEPLRAVWRPLSFFQTSDAPPLYPDGLLGLLEAKRIK